MRNAPPSSTKRSPRRHASGIGCPRRCELLLHPERKRALDAASVDGRRARSPEDLAALAVAARLAQRRARLRRRWEAQATAIGAPAVLADDAEPEASCRRRLPLMRAALEWTHAQRATAVAALTDAGLRADVVFAEADLAYSECDVLERFERVVADVLPAVLAAERGRRQTAELDALPASVRTATAVSGAAETTKDLRDAAEACDATRYAAAYAEVERRTQLAPVAGARRDALRRIDATAPQWAAAIAARRGVHGAGVPPGEVRRAWRIRQFADELDRRDARSASDLLAQLEAKRAALRETTIALVDRRAWAAQRRRTTPEQHEALISFVQAKKRIGRGTGKRAPEFRKLARLKLTEARTAVPVWIMPIVKAAELFDARVTQFDVVIVDEASQSDVTGLIAFFLGKRIIVVGDDEQVSPLAVGELVEESQRLIDEFLARHPVAGTLRRQTIAVRYRRANLRRPDVFARTFPLRAGYHSIQQSPQLQRPHPAAARSDARPPAARGRVRTRRISRDGRQTQRGRSADDCGARRGLHRTTGICGEDLRRRFAARGRASAAYRRIPATHLPPREIRGAEVADRETPRSFKATNGT